MSDDDISELRRFIAGSVGPQRHALDAVERRIRRLLESIDALHNNMSNEMAKSAALAARLEATEAALREAQKRCKRAIDIYEDAGGIIAENEPLIVIERDLSRALAALDKEEQRKFRADTGLEDIPENVKLRHMTAVEAAALDKETPLEPGFSVEYGPMRGIGPEETQG